MCLPEPGKKQQASNILLHTMRLSTNLLASNFHSDSEAMSIDEIAASVDPGAKHLRTGTRVLSEKCVGNEKELLNKN